MPRPQLLLEMYFRRIWVTGELSNLASPPPGTCISGLSRTAKGADSLCLLPPARPAASDGYARWLAGAGAWPREPVLKDPRRLQLIVDSMEKR